MQLYVNSRNVAGDESDHFGSIQIAYDAGLLTYSDKDGFTAARAFIDCLLVSSIDTQLVKRKNQHKLIVTIRTTHLQKGPRLLFGMFWFEQAQKEFPFQIEKHHSGGLDFCWDSFFSCLFNPKHAKKETSPGSFFRSKCRPRTLKFLR